MKKITSIWLFALISLVSMTVFGQVSGKVVDEAGPLSDVNVMVQGTKQGAVTDFDGNFSIPNAKDGVLELSFLGYGTKKIDFKAGQKLGTIILVNNGESIEEIVIVGTGVIDLAEGRKTPIAVSTIKASDIIEKVGNSDLPELLKSTPSVQSLQGGGFGDGQMFLRGFDQTNTAFLLNGQPINGMEDGKMYWSNWSGVLDIANAVQVQRGLGSSKLAISSVGGTVNIVTKTVDKKEGGFIQQMVGNDNYLKTTAYYSTGLNEKGFSFSGLLGHWQGDGYRDGADGQGQTYFLSFGYKPNEKHLFNFLITGAPQWHSSGGYRVRLEDYLESGLRYNNNYDDYGSETYSRGRNFYHKPVMNLSWDYKMSDKTSISSVAYGSFGRGGFATYGGFNYGLGQHSLDQQIADPNQNPYVRASMNNHNWFGLISNLNTELNENMSVNFGLDGRIYNGKHYRQLVDNFGQGDVTLTEDSGYSVTLTEGHGFNPWDALFQPVTNDDEKFDRNYQEWINYIGVFGQFEYSKDALSSFFQGAISTQSYQREGFLIQDSTQTGLGKGDTENKIGFNLKGGAAYELTENHKVFANVGYYSKQPYLDNIYASVRYNQEFLEPKADNEEVLGLEFGYQFTNRNNLTANFNLYHTTWSNRTLNLSGEILDDNVFTTLRDMEQVHTGAELEVSYKPLSKLKIDGFVSVGNWVYSKEADSFEYTDGVLTDQSTFYLKDVKVGEAAQTTVGISTSYEVVKNLKLRANANYNDQLHGGLGIGDGRANSDFEDPNNLGAIELPSYTTVDAGFSYKMPVGKDKRNSVNLNFNVNNVFEEKYIERSSTNTHADATTTNWKGVNVRNRVNMGYGRTWNFSLRYKF